MMEIKQMGEIKIEPWDVQDFLDTPESIVAYLNAVLEESDPALLQAALGDIAKAKGMTALAKDTGLGRESLYKSLSTSGNPAWQTISKVLHSFGLKLQVVRA